MKQYHQQGLTLLELLVAVSILALISLASATTLNSTINSERSIHQRASSLETLSYALSILRQDLEQAIGRPFTGASTGYSQSQPMTGFNNELSNSGLLLRFVRSGKRSIPTSKPSSNLEHIWYYLIDGRLVRASSPVPSPLEDTRHRKKTIISGLEHIEFFYYDDSWTDNWSITSPKNHLPRAIRLVLTTSLWGRVEQTILLSGPPDEG